MSTITINRRATFFLKLFIALLFATATSAFPTDNGLLQNSGVQIGCTEGCNNYNGVLEANNVTSMGYGSNASSALSVTTGMGFMAMFLWTMFSLL